MTSANYSIQPTMSIAYFILANRLSTILYTMIYILGFVGNTLALLTFSTRRMRQISSSIFLLILSISDIMALVTSLWFFLSDAFAIHLQNYSALACRFRTFFAYVFMDLSSWCIAGLAVDRYLRTKFPLSSKAFCTPRNASIVVFIFFLVLCGINGHYFSPGIGQERSKNRTTAHCLENREQYPNYFYFYKIIWPKIDAVIFCFLPACVMIFCNVSIIYLVKRQRRHIENFNYDSREAMLKPIGGLLMKKVSFAHRKAIERQMSWMMIACVIAFLCTTVPVTVYLILLEHVIMKNPQWARNNALFIFIFRMLRVLMYTHFGSNFYLYCLTSRIFRMEFVQTITCRRCFSHSYPEPLTSQAAGPSTHQPNDP